MIDIRKRAILSGLDLNIEVRNLSLLRTSAEGSHASRHARVCAADGPFAALHIPPLRGRALRRSQGAGVLLPRSVLRDGFAQLTARESLRDIEVNLRAQSARLYHMGFRCKPIARNTPANANATRPGRCTPTSRST
ncbi:MAG: DUF4372 domain-containing protein [Burkholderiales bacterium]|nr:DUF4372 domain-containing protein [Burkholderiales bacterium]